MFLKQAPCVLLVQYNRCERARWHTADRGLVGWTRCRRGHDACASIQIYALGIRARGTVGLTQLVDSIFLTVPIGNCCYRSFKCNVSTLAAVIYLALYIL